MKRWLVRVLGLNVRHGVRFASGERERTGFRTARHARAYLDDSGYVGIVFSYTPAVDMRLPGFTPPTRDRFTGDSDRAGAS